MTTSSIHEAAQAIRERHKRKAYERELKGRGPDVLKTPFNLADSISALSDIEGSDAEAAAQEIYRSSEDLAALQQAIQDLPDQVLNYVYASVCYRYFTKKYFPGYVEMDFTPKYHDEYFPILRAVETHQTIYPALVCGPRMWGKSTLGSILMPIHAVIFPVEITQPNGKVIDLSKKFIMLVSAAQGASKRTLGSILAELEENDAIRTDFGEFYRDPDSKTSRNKTWSKEVAVTHNGIRLEAHTRKTKIKGANYRGARPDLVIADDLEDDENTDNVNIRDRDFIWYNKIVIPARSKKNGNVLTLGNLDNPDGLCERIKKHAEKHGHLVKVFKVFEIDEKTGKKVYTWPAEFGPEFEAETIEMIGEEAYELEYQMNTHAAHREIKRKEFQYYDPADIRDKLHQMWLFASCDQASGKKTSRHDNTAIGGIAYDKLSRVHYVLPAIIGKIDKINQPKTILEYHAQWDFLEFHIESGCDQGALCVSVEDQALDEDIVINVCEINAHTQHKHDRIAQRLINRIKNGKILFIKGDPSHEIIIDELVRLGQKGVKDDAADMLEMAVRAKDKKLFGKKAKDTERGMVVASTIAVNLGKKKYAKKDVSEDDDERDSGPPVREHGIRFSVLTAD